MSSSAINLRANLRDILELVLLPGLAIVLPWPLSFRLFRLFSRLPWLYSEQVNAMRFGMSDFGVAEVSADYCAKFRLVQLVDHADLYLSMTRTDRWLDRYLNVEDGYLAKNPEGFLLSGFHWGAGLWVFRYLRRAGKASAFLYRGFDGSAMKGQWVKQWYFRRRINEVERGSGVPAIQVGNNSSARMLENINNGVVVVALVDVPPNGKMTCLPVELQGVKAAFPRGVIRLSVAEQIPMTNFSMGVDLATGQRLLTITGPLRNQSEEMLAADTSSAFNRCLNSEPAAWHFWAYVRAYLNATD